MWQTGESDNEGLGAGIRHTLFYRSDEEAEEMEDLCIIQLFNVLILKIQAEGTYLWGIIRWLWKTMNRTSAFAIC